MRKVLAILIGCLWWAQFNQAQLVVPGKCSNANKFCGGG